MTTVLITDYAWPDLDIERGQIEAAGFEVIEAPDDREATLCELAARADAILACWVKVTAAVLEAAPNCRIVGRMGIGLDNIDVEHCTHRSIPVTNVPDYCQTEVAEHALALIFCLARNITAHHLQTKHGDYDLDAGLPIYRVAGKTLGILGFGRIGSALANLAVAVGMRVITTSNRKELGASSRCKRDELFRQSDFISLHLPMTDELRHTIGAAEIAAMKPSAFIINTARGGLIDHAALGRALDENHIAGAALDVHSPEPPDLTSPLYQHPRVIATPHSAFVSEHSVAELRTRATRQVVDFLQGQTPANVVNPSVLQ